MKKYLAHYYFSVKIEIIHIEKETKVSYWTNGSPSRKETQYKKMFDSFDDAKNFLISHNESEVSCARRNLENKKGKLGNAKGLQEKHCEVKP